MGAQFYLKEISTGLFTDLLSSVSLNGDEDSYVYTDLTSSEYDYSSEYDLDETDPIAPSPTSSDNITFESADILPSHFIVIAPPLD